uniref:Uncharacterized protein n=1 Tax=Tanacetum cinerariifolium TaxID=118510 RepID=A0A6L2PAY2_TANCI|nr:hypothetical protein [Tanacetum cinerariifolium]
MSAKRTAWNEFSSFIASAVICLATGRKFNFSKYIFNSMDDAEVEEDEDDNEVPDAPSPPTPATTSPPQRARIPSLPQAQPTQPSSPPQQQPSKTASISESSMTLLNILMLICATLTQKVANLEQDKIAQALKITKLKQRVRKLEKKRKFKSRMHPNRGRGIDELDVNEDVTLVDVDVDTQGRMTEDVTVVKDINAIESEPTVFDDEEVTMSMAQTLIKMKAEKAKILDKHMEKRLNIVAEQMQEKHLDNVKKYQSLKRKPISVAQAKKNMIVYLKNMAGYKIQHFKGMTYDQNMLQIVPMAKFKVESLQVKYPLIDWEIYSEGSRTYWRMIRVGGITQAF